MDYHTLRNMDLNLLVVLDVLLSEASVTKASQKLGLTQSAVSHALSRTLGGVVPRSRAQAYPRADDAH